jgi:hypothetical protein
LRGEGAVWRSAHVVMWLDPPPPSYVISPRDSTNIKFENGLWIRNISFHSSVALQPFVGPWPLLQFHNLFYTDGRTPWTSVQPVARPLPTLRTT